jgi:hypothetical protein
MLPPRAARLAISFLLLTLGGAQAPLPVQENWSQQDWGAVETVVVTAEGRGPAIWRLRRGGGEAWILGTVGPMPEDLQWNRDSLKPFIAGARQLLLPPAPDVNFVDAAWFYLWNGDLLRQPRGQTLEASLPEPLRADFATARGLARQDPDRYATDTPLVAAIRLQRDLTDARDLSRAEPRRTVERMARAARIRITRMGSFEMMPTVRTVLALPQDRQRPCLAQAVADAGRMAQQARPAAEAWADGNIAAVKAHYAETRLLECITTASQQAAAINALSVSLIVGGLDEALKAPGKSVAVISIGPLLRQGGVLEQLAARGVTIDHPAE